MSRLRETLEATGLPLRDLTVLAPQNDPYRVDTPARHRDGEWLAVNASELGLGNRRIHLRGLHYMLIGRPRPDGTPYSNTHDDWLWLSGDAGKQHAGSATSTSSRSSISATPPLRFGGSRSLRRGRTSRLACTSGFPTLAISFPVSVARISPGPSRSSSSSSARSRRSKMCSARSPDASKPICTCQPGRSPTRCCTRWRRPPSMTDGRCGCSASRTATRLGGKCWYRSAGS
jgi:hypothetical protein